MGGLKGTQGEKRIVQGVLTGKRLNERQHLEDLGVDFRIIVKQFLQT
jgi:hypothetical protein